MKHYVDVYIPAKTVQKVDNISCDFCGETIAVGCFDVDDVKIIHTKGISYPECMYATEYSVDMCGKCFALKFVPWAKSEGAELSMREIDTF